ncbi:hypothetical protein [Nocardia heshunensis]
MSTDSNLQSQLILEGLGLTTGTNVEGYLYAQGPAALVKSAAKELEAVGQGSVVTYDDPGETGTATLVVTGNSEDDDMRPDFDD